MIGDITYINGFPYFQFGKSVCGFIFKDENAYKNYWSAPCYVPEYHDQHETIVEINGRYFDCGGEKKCWYSHDDILEECTDCWDHMNEAEHEELGFENINDLCDYVFKRLEWQHPVTVLHDIGCNMEYL